MFSPEKEDGARANVLRRLEIEMRMGGKSRRSSPNILSSLQLHFEIHHFCHFNAQGTERSDDIHDSENKDPLIEEKEYL
jgi:hypothetical protein